MVPIWPDWIRLHGAFVLFPIILLLPGYVVGMTTNVLRFRQEGAQLSKSLLLSLAVCPWVTHILLRFAGFGAVWAFYGCCTAFALALFFRAFHRGSYRDVLNRRTLIRAAWIAAAYLFASLLLIDFHDGERLFRPLMSYDFVKHNSVTNAISRDGLPPTNPSLYPLEAIPLFYYYFWFMLCSLVDVMGGPFVDPKAAVQASALWSGFALCALLHVYLQTLGPKVVIGLKKKHYALGFVLLLVTGLDIIPITMTGILSHVAGRDPLPQALWWNELIASWCEAVFWVPHHICAFAVCTFVFLLIQFRSPDEPISFRTETVLIPVALASSLGMSIWVTLVAGGCLIVWCIFTWSRGWRRETVFLLIVGVASILLTVPFLIDLHQANHLNEPPVTFHVRPFSELDYYLTEINPVLLHTISFVLLPINYFFELGFFFLGGLLYLAYRIRLKRRWEREELFLLVVMITSLVICTFVRSSIQNNDLGWRGFMYIQFILLLYSIPLLAQLMGAPGTKSLDVTGEFKQLAYAMLVLSSILMAAEFYVRRFHPDGPTGAGTLAVRHAYEWVDRNLDRDIIMQHRPESLIEYFHGLYGNRQVVVSDEMHGKLYGVNEALFDSTIADIYGLFQPYSSYEENARQVERYGIDAIMVKRTDPIWSDENGWLSGYPVIYESTCCRIYAVSQRALPEPQREAKPLRTREDTR